VTADEAAAEAATEEAAVEDTVEEEEGISAETGACKRQ
jgi:hypothetical protein